MKKYIAELLGTFTLTFFGCGSAIFAGDKFGTLGTLGVAFAFGLSIVCMAYAIGHVSGCHINPAVSLGCLTAKKMTAGDFVGYVISQCIGAFIAALLLLFLMKQCPDFATKTLGGTNGYGPGISAVGISLIGALIVEIVLTFVFVLTILGVTSFEKMAPIAGIVIGLVLVFVHIMGIPLTGTSVNPARSLGPALVAGGTALSQVWVFIVAPLIGGLLAGLAWNFFKPAEETEAK
ncbi:MIP family channel protein [Candidatus Sumerlaeota bacterium]|nr:MIP family channel protein [Candidatus Sumerlaeota bacterium]